MAQSSNRLISKLPSKMSNQENGQRDIGTLLVDVTIVTADTIFVLIKVLYSIILSLLQNIIKPTPKPVRGEIALITGAGHGIGKELALLYASEGATVVVWDINRKTGEQTVAEIAKLGYPKAHYFSCDVSNRENVLAVAKEVQDKVGDVTILFNNAGIMPTRPFLEQTTEEIERMMNINVMAHFWTLQAFLPSMKKNNHGHIVTLSSSAGIFGIPNLVPYCAAKFAVKGMMEALYQEFRADRRCEIKFTTICPYMVDTGLCKKPKIRFASAMPLVTPKEAAANIMDAQRNDMLEISIPRYIWYGNIIQRTLPRKAQDYIADFIGVGLESD